MFKFIHKKTTIAFAVFVIGSPLLMKVTDSFLSFMLGFNIGLAFIPLFLIWLINNLLNKSDGKIKYYHVLLAILFILFFPNTFYVITDAIHISSSLFYTYDSLYSPTLYLENISAYIMLIHILTTIGFGIYAGAESLYQFKKALSTIKLTEIYQQAVIIVVIILSSVGIYIGRFMRLFSWEILNPIQIISSLYERSNTFMLLFILLFTAIQLGIHYTYQAMKKKMIYAAASAKEISYE